MTGALATAVRQAVTRARGDVEAAVEHLVTLAKGDGMLRLTLIRKAAHDLVVAEMRGDAVPARRLDEPALHFQRFAPAPPPRPSGAALRGAAERSLMDSYRLHGGAMTLGEASAGDLAASAARHDSDSAAAARSARFERLVARVVGNRRVREALDDKRLAELQRAAERSAEATDAA